MRRAQNAFAVDDNPLISIVSKSGRFFLAGPADAAVRLQQSGGGWLRNMIGQPAAADCSRPAATAQSGTRTRLRWIALAAPKSQSPPRSGYGLAVEQAETRGMLRQCGVIWRARSNWAVGYVLKRV